MYKTPPTAGTINRLKIAFSFVVLGVIIFQFVEQYHSIGKRLFMGIIIEPAFLVLLIILATLNLSFETKKWMSLSRGMVFFQAFAAVLQGMAAGFITPNRVGEFAGRMASLPKGSRTKGGLMTIVGAMIQGSVTIVFGLAGLLIFPYQNVLEKLDLSFSKWILPIGVLFVIGVLAFAFRNKIAKHIDQLKAYLMDITRKQAIHAFTFATLRYVVFSSQFALCLIICGFEGGAIALFSGIVTVYFIQSYIPFSAFGELGIREILAVLIFGAYMPNPFNAAIATLILWVFNLALPVLAGLIIQKRIKA